MEVTAEKNSYLSEATPICLHEGHILSNKQHNSSRYTKKTGRSWSQTKLNVVLQGFEYIKTNHLHPPERLVKMQNTHRYGYFV